MHADVVNLMVALGILGAILVASGNPWEGHLIWLITNIGLVIHNYLIKQRSQALMFGIYFFSAAWGLYTWS